MRVLARRLVKFRDLRRLSQTALAGRSGVSRKTLNALESGQAADVLVSTLEALGHSLRVTLDALLGQDELPLVRLAAPCDYLGRSVSDFVSPRTCWQCGVSIPARALHPLGECMMAMSDRGRSAASIGAVFGLRAISVESVLRDEHEARRKRRF